VNYTRYYNYKQTYINKEIGMTKKDELKTLLVEQIAEWRKEYKLTQVELAELMGISQPRLSTILNCRFDLVSLDYLVDQTEFLERKLKAA